MLINHKSHRRLFVLIIALILLLIALFVFIPKINNIEKNADEILTMKLALIFPFQDRVSSNKGPYTKNEDFNISRIGDIEFKPLETGVETIYYSNSNVDFNKYTNIVAYLKDLYGQPTHIKNNLYMWVSEDGRFELKSIYSTEIYNNCAISVEYQ